MPGASSASNVFFSDDLPEASGSNYQLLNKSSPLPQELNSSQTSSQRRGVAWSEQIDNVKLFYKSDSIHPSLESPTKSSAPPSIRSYLHEQNLNVSNSSHSTPIFRITQKYAPSPLSSQASSPSVPRSILKPRVSDIRIAASAEEGGWLNKEPARLLVCGKRPRIVARDSFQVAKMRGVSAQPLEEKGKGKAKADDAPAAGVNGEGMGLEERSETDSESEEEEEETIEEGGALMTASLVDIILNGAEDLLTLEEAYTTLTLRLRAKLAAESNTSDVTSGTDESIRIAIHPVREEAPAIVRAIQRDLGRLLGKFPGSTRSDREPSPFSALQPLRDLPNSSPKSDTSLDSPKRRQGYTEAEIRYRREAAGVGQSALKFLAAVFRAHQLHECFSEADLTTLLDHAMIIPRTAKMPTFNPKRSYRWTIFLLAQMRIPAISVGPVQDKIVSAVEAAMSGALVPAGSLRKGKEDELVRKEGVNAAVNLIITYPSLFLNHYATLLPPLIRGMYDPVVETRMSSSAACAAFTAAKINMQSQTTNALLCDPTPASRAEWQKTKAVIQKMEFWVVAHLKATIKDSGPVAERRTNGDLLVGKIKQLMGNPDGVLWSCGAWSVVVSLMGGAYASSGTVVEAFDYVMERALQMTANTNRPVLGRAAWNHAIHAYMTAATTTSLSPDNTLIRSFDPFPFADEDELAKRINLLQFPVDLAIKAVNLPEGVRKALHRASDGTERYSWHRTEKSKNRQKNLITYASGALPIIYAYSGMALYHQDQPVKEDLSSDASVEAGPSGTLIERLDQTWDKVVRPILTGLLTVEGVDELTYLSWDILSAITSPEPATSTWSLDTLLSNRYLNGSVFVVANETTVTNTTSDLEAEAMQVEQLPAWGADWVVNRLPDLLDVLQEAMVSVFNLDRIEAGGCMTASGDAVIPSQITRIWGNLLSALASVRLEQPEKYVEGVKIITSRLVTLWGIDPATCLPLGMFSPRGCVLDLDETRSTIMDKLVDIAVDVLGANAFRDTIFAQPSSSTSDSPLPVFGAGIHGESSPCSVLLTALLRSPSLSLTLTSPARTAFIGLIQKLINLSESTPYNIQLLADIIDALPQIFAQDPSVQLGIWQTIVRHSILPDAVKYPNYDPTALLRSLLVAPFRSEATISAWLALSDLTSWAAMLRLAIDGSEDRRECLDTVAIQLKDTFGDETTASAISAWSSCLAMMVAEILPLAPSRASYNLPRDLLSLVAEGLHQTHPKPSSQSLSPEVEQAISPSVELLIQALTTAYSLAPVWSAQQLLNIDTSGALYMWLGSSISLPQSLASSLDQFYCTALDLLSRAISAGEILPTGQTLDTYSELYGPRLSLAGSRVVIDRFERFWSEGFAGLDLDLSEPVREFLLEVMAAMPGLIEVKGLEQPERMGEAESQRRFPHSQSFVAGPMSTALVPASDPAAENEAVSLISNGPAESTQDYDADISNSSALPINDTIAAIQVEQPEQQLASPLPIGSLPPSSPVRIEDSVESSNNADEPRRSDDVFGPPAMVDQRKRARRPSNNRLIGATQSFPEMSRKRVRLDERDVESLPINTTVIPDSQDDEGDKTEEDEDDDVEVVEARVVPDKGKGKEVGRPGPEQEQAAPSILNRLLTKASSFGFFSSPNRRDEPGFEAIPASGFYSKTSSKRPAPDSDPIPRPSSSTKKPHSDRPMAKRSKPSRRRSRTSSHSGSDSSDAIVVSDDEQQGGKGRVDEDDDDEEEDEEDVPAEPSPETVNRLRAEKLAHGGILHKSKLNPSPLPNRQKPRSKNAKVEVVIPIPTKGRYDDASEASIRLAPAREAVLPSASPIRTTQQARILSMVEDAAKAKAAVASLDFDGVISLLKHVNELRDAATANLQERAVRERGGRR